MSPKSVLFLILLLGLAGLGRLEDAQDDHISVENEQPASDSELAQDPDSASTLEAESEAENGIEPSLLAEENYLYSENEQDQAEQTCPLHGHDHEEHSGHKVQCDEGESKEACAERKQKAKEQSKEQKQKMREKIQKVMKRKQMSEKVREFKKLLHVELPKSDSYRLMTGEVRIPDDVLVQLKLNPLEAIRYWNYPAETHKVITRDGYILTMYRIPHGRSGPGNGSRRPAVYIVHGLGAGSHSYLPNPPEGNLPLLLADAGFDVWLGNMRGNKYSRAHTTLNPDSEEDISFWRFSFDHIAKFDLPAAIDYILEKTGNTGVGYVGHSLGTAIMFAGLSTSEQLQGKVRLMAALTPVASVKYISGIASLLAPFADIIMAVMEELKIGEFGGVAGGVADIAHEVCKEEEKPNVCEIVLDGLTGYEAANTNRSRLPLYVAYSAGGTSVRNVHHLAQLVNADEPEFKQYDFGPVENLAVYGQITPPHYDLTRIRVPMAFFRSDSDILSTKNDVIWLKSRLADNRPGVVFDSHVDTYSHVDFIWGINAYERVYKDLVRLMKQYVI